MGVGVQLAGGRFADAVGGYFAFGYAVGCDFTEECRVCADVEPAVMLTMCDSCGPILPLQRGVP